MFILIFIEFLIMSRIFLQMSALRVSSGAAMESKRVCAPPVALSFKSSVSPLQIRIFFCVESYD